MRLFSTFPFDDDRWSNFVNVFPNSHIFRYSRNSKILIFVSFVHIL